MNTLNPLFKQIKQILTEELGIKADDITPDATLNEKLGMTSLEFLNAVVIVEEQFEIVTDEDILKTLDTVADFVEYIASLLNAK